MPARAPLRHALPCACRTRLDEGAQALPHDIGERLRVAREQAIEAARAAREVAWVARAFRCLWPWRRVR